MTGFFTLARKLLGESKWLLGLSSAALFGLGWLSVFITGRIEARMRQVAGTSGGGNRMNFLRGMGGDAMDFSSTAIELAWWNHPFILLTVAIWAISKGSSAVAGEVERGTLDVTLSRPLSRTSYLAAHVLVGVLGLMTLAAALIAGNRIGTQYNPIEGPPGVLVLAKPALNYVALGLAMYGYTLMLSSIDLVRWRPNLIGSVATLAAYVALVIASVPSFDEYPTLKLWLGRLSIFKAYNPVEAAVKGENFAFNAGILAAVGATGIVLAFLAFTRRDLPAGGG
jgi:ABC-2 type transport system permease protein